MDRRDLWRPRDLLRAVDDFQHGLERSVTELQRSLSGPLVTFKRPAMACEFAIQFPAAQTDRRTPMAALDRIADLEQQMTVYREDSEVSRINRGAYPNPMPVEPLLFGLVKRCQQLHAETHGAFDITAGPLIRAWGFRRRRGRVPDEAEIEACRAVIGANRLELDSRRKTIRFPGPGMEINLGAIGKGYALDRVAVLLRSAGFRDVVLSAGHSSILATGHPPWDDAWQLDILDPTNPRRVLADVRLRDRGLSTSGVAEQFFVHEGRRYGHLIDPRTGWPTTGMLQVTVVATDAATSEALSTAFFVNGPSWAREYCRHHPDTGALLVRDPGPVGTPRVEVVGKIDARPRVAA